MSTFRFKPLLAAASLAVLTVAAPLALAGHLNILLNAELDGRQEVSAVATSNAIVGDPNGRGEFYAFGIDGNRDTLCYNLQAKRIAELDMAPGNGRAAHIHRGAAGENGPVVANLAWPQGGQSADCLNGLTQSARFVLANTQFADAQALIADILANPQNYYVNVHNSVYTAGVIRGQLRVAEF
ncbi:MAG: CHRD domain-containing protein [Burkholderiaceae bacterium]